ncbi:NADPH-dependent 1-acyl dihydroxyacetone phosphate reductase [Yamadazyma tenuis]|uniref:NADPH-dependent 1-acyl dihydroxyacetone phosphate reductase n=1 Tax=Candida tenuis TaxID=2315449 RepID=UPI0027A509D1|nr:NADPH-dependent 1-acyl dihydroxyacetone phosphate reductase [Yamadazyma tenuis]
MSDSKTVVVTGASSGIGLAVAREFALKGYNVIAGARRLSSMEELKKYNVTTVELDITSPESVEKLKKLIETEYDGAIKYLLNNAGQSCAAAAVEVSDDEVFRCFEVNVFGHIRVTRELAPFVIKTKGTIGFTGSVQGILETMFLGVYASSKAAIQSYASGMAFEMAPFGVKVVNFVTGGVRTAMSGIDLKSVLYDEEGLEEVKKAYSELTKTGMDSHVYARKVIKDFEHSKLGVVHHYRGAGSTTLNDKASKVKFLDLVDEYKEFKRLLFL